MEQEPLQRTISESYLFVVVQGAGPAADGGTRLVFERALIDGVPYIPLFTSAAALKRSLFADDTAVGLTPAELLAFIVDDDRLIVDMGSDDATRWSAAQFAALLLYATSERGAGLSGASE